MKFVDGGHQALRINQGLPVSPVLSAWCLVSALFIRSLSYAGAGTDAADFLRVNPDSHSAALGNSGVANRESAFSLFHNPALLSQGLSRVRMAGTRMEWLQGVQASHYGLSFSWSRENDKVWGLGLSLSDWRTGEFDATDPSGNRTGRVGFKAQTLGLSVGHKVFSTLHLGLGVKKISQNFQETGAGAAGKTAASALAWDLGLTYNTPFQNILLGAAVQNLGSKTGFTSAQESLPTQARLGLQGQAWGGKMAWSLETTHDREKSFSLKGGVGYSPYSLISLRLGYDTVMARPDFVGVTSGVGLRVAQFHIDYSFVPFSALGTTQRISMSWQFGKGPADLAGPAKSGRWLSRSDSVAGDENPRLVWNEPARGGSR